MNEPVEPRRSLAHVLAINRTVGIVLVSVLFFGLGEQLWEKFLPVYLQAQSKEVAESAQSVGAVSWSALWAVGLYCFFRNLFEGFCYIGGGQITAQLGDRGSLLLFGLLTVLGYLLFLVSSAPAVSILAALLILGWEPLSVPVTFTTVGATVDDARRGMAFAIQSIQKRLPRIIGPPVAGMVLDAAIAAHGKEGGQVAGMHWLIVIALALGLVSLAVQWRWMPHHDPSPVGPPARDIFRQLHPTLRRLLIAEIFTRWCDWLVREFVVIYIVAVRGVSLTEAGFLMALQNLVALATYLPVGQLTKKAGLQPFIGVTFVFFALFPLVLATAPGQWGLVLAFVVNGLREIGEPARKALITSLMPPEWRARGVGWYWGTRSFALSTSSLAGAAIWYGWGPKTLLYCAFGFGCLGAMVFYGFCRENKETPLAE